MSKRGRCFVQILDGKIVRIFHKMYVAQLSGKEIREYPRRDAVIAIREQVYTASKGQCRDCGKLITNRFHMHEEVPRSKGGEVSIWNSIALCAACHILRDDSAHGNRRLRFGESNAKM